jgi:hypothetical protein
MRNDGKCDYCEAYAHCQTDSRGAMCASNTLESLPTDKQLTKYAIPSQARVQIPPVSGIYSVAVV